ncbi:Polypyrimidine tract-binding protein-like protein 1 [Hibiscus syriacus]|uniref:Polypyrimidine tract-binding protein-like protein 1 n=1 Tax=Hibiscus syriacus TaxID=106335 RepID=A0A6A3BNU2_HIBSY|nr:Polypyrimidine tract-binding protein-like protein 1 [Hibiscus syriacus]
MSTSSQPQFRYTQTPSKVLHLRNLPWECSEEELVELCKPFGKIVNTKCNVGANRNQAFVEFVDLNQAISMVSYYASSSEPAQSPGDTPGNVLLVTIEGVETNDVTIETIHLVFSAFGFVHKIATFEKAAGFQALIQFTDAETASSARNALDGRSIPRHALLPCIFFLLPHQHIHFLIFLASSNSLHIDYKYHVTCHLRISYSAHTDLNIKFQSHRSRDYTDPYLPVNPTAMEGLMQPVVGPDGKKQEPQSNVLLASIENMQYAVTVDVFSAFGAVQKIAIFEKNGGTQALIQYPDVMTAAVAKESLEGHCIYDGGYCKLHLSYSRHTDLNVKRLHHPDLSLLATQVPGMPAGSNAWQNPQSAPLYPGTNYAASAAIQAQPFAGQIPAWDPSLQARPPYGSVPGQAYQPSAVCAYERRTTCWFITLSQPGVASMGMVPPGANVRPGGAPSPGQPPYYGQ